jgi:hypothetical protein
MQLDFLGKMRDMRIFSVDSIESTLNLADKSIAAYEDLMIEVTPDGLNVLISKTCAPPRRNLVICKEVGHLLEVDTIKLLSLVAQPEKTLKELFELEGIPNVARDTHDTPNWTRSAVRNLSNAEPRRQHSAESPSNAGGVQGHVGDAQSLGGDVQSHASDIQSHASDIQSHAGANGIVQPGPAFDAGLQEEIARAKQISLTSGFFPTPDQIHFASSGNFTAKSAEALSQISSANFTPQDVKGVSDLALPSTDLDLCAAVEDHLELSSELYSQAGSGAGPGTSNASKYQRVSGVLGEHYVRICLYN